MNQDQKQRFHESYGMMPHGYRWQVESSLNLMPLQKKPWTKYGSTECPNGMKDMYVMNVSHSGIGDGMVQLTVWFDVDERLMVPLDCELT